MRRKQVDRVVRNAGGGTGWRPRLSLQDSASSPARGGHARFKQEGHS